MVNSLQSRRILRIDVIRGFLCIWIVLCHIFGWTSLIGPNRSYLSFFSFIANGNNAVTFFLIISGFVLYLPFCDGRRTLYTFNDIKKYLFRRSGRILPLYIFSGIILTGLASEFLSPKISITNFFVFSTFAYTFIPPYVPVLNPSLWFMGIAWWCSICLPVLDVIIRKIGASKSLILFLSLGFTVRLFHLSYAHENESLHQYVNHLFGRIDDFVMGMCIAVAFAKGFRLRSFSSIIPIAGFFVLWVFTSKNYATSFPVQLHAFQFTLSSIVIGLIFFCILSIERAFFLKLTLPLQIIGRMSFSIYIWHGPMMHILPHTNIYRFIWYWLVLLLLSLFTYRFIESADIKGIRLILPKMKKTTNS